eukprot:scaffold242598_cov55-Attheya_sp.AAC.1
MSVVYSSGMSLIWFSAFASGSIANSIPWYIILRSCGSTWCVLKVCRISLSRLALVFVLAEHVRKWVSVSMSLLHLVHLLQGARSRCWSLLLKGSQSIMNLSTNRSWLGGSDSIADPKLYQSIVVHVSFFQLYFFVRYCRISWDEYALRIVVRYDQVMASLTMMSEHLDAG